jgi:hypothetical protein
MSGMMDPGMFMQILQALGGTSPVIGVSNPVTADPSVAQPPPLDPQAKIVAQGGQKTGGFPINAATLAALGAINAGLQAGRPGPAPMAGTPHVATRAPGGFSPVYNRLPGRG